MTPTCRKARPSPAIILRGVLRLPESVGASGRGKAGLPRGNCLRRANAVCVMRPNSARGGDHPPYGAFPHRPCRGEVNETRPERTGTR